MDYGDITALDPVTLNILNQAQGDILYYNGTNWVRLPAGTAGQRLETQGAGSNPTWENEQSNLTGDVTSVGLATTIANNAVTVGKIATGTDGELITWDASGNPTTVAVGTADQLLTSNGPGAAPTFQDAPAGAEGAAISSFTAHSNSGVGGGGDSWDLGAGSWTETTDVGGDFNAGTGVFTAPQTGLYLFTACISINFNFQVAGQGFLKIGGYRVAGWFTNSGINTNVTLGGSIIRNLTSGNTVSVSANMQAQGSGGTNGGGSTTSHFTGTLLA